MRFKVNGEPKDLDTALTLLNLLKEMGIKPGRVAVAVNSTVIPRGKLGEKMLSDGDSVEVIEAVGGG